MSEEPVFGPEWYLNGIWYGGHMPGDTNPTDWPYARGHVDPKTAAVIALLEDWFWFIELGTAHLHLPDPNYTRPEGKKLWAEADINRIIAAIDEEYRRELGHDGDGWAAKKGAQDGPGFYRLGLLQRLALVQQLEQTLLRFPDPPHPDPPQWWGYGGGDD